MQCHNIKVACMDFLLHGKNFQQDLITYLVPIQKYYSYACASVAVHSNHVTAVEQTGTFSNTFSGLLNMFPRT